MAYCSRYKVILVGDYGVGKTSLFKRLRGESFYERPSSTLSKGVGREKCTKSYTLHNGDLVTVRDMMKTCILQDSGQLYPICLAELLSTKDFKATVVLHGIALLA